VELAALSTQVERGERYSTRQGDRVAVSGFTGTACYRGPFGPFLPLLWALEELKVGKSTVFGLGKIRVVAPQEPAAGEG